MRVWNIGFGRTGTTSLQRAMLHLGFSAYHDNTVCDNDVRAVLTKKSLRAKGSMTRAMGGDVAYTGGEEAARRYRELVQMFPDDRFILTTRNVEHWIDSELVNVLMHRVTKPGNAENEDICTEDLRRAFVKHVDDVVHFFHTAGVSHRLLVFNCCDGHDGWPELCRFLNRSVVAGPFVHTNVSGKQRMAAIREALLKRSKRGG